MITTGNYLFTLLFLLALQQHTDGTDNPTLGDFFGFSDLEIIKIGDNPGPMYTGDLNVDGVTDILVVNNRKSRIDLFLQKQSVR